MHNETVGPFKAHLTRAALVGIALAALGSLRPTLASAQFDERAGLWISLGGGGTITNRTQCGDMTDFVVKSHCRREAPLAEARLGAMLGEHTAIGVFGTYAQWSADYTTSSSGEYFESYTTDSRDELLTIGPVIRRYLGSHLFVEAGGGYASLKDRKRQAGFYTSGTRVYSSTYPVPERASGGFLRGSVGFDFGTNLGLGMVFGFGQTLLPKVEMQMLGFDNGRPTLVSDLRSRNLSVITATIMLTKF